MTDWIKSVSWLIFWVLLAATVAALVAWQAYRLGERDAEVRHAAAIKVQKQEAAQVLGAETTKVSAAEKALADFKTNQEKLDAQNQAVTADYARRLRAAAAAAGPAGRLRDPNAVAGCGGGGGSAEGATVASSGSRAHDATEGAGLLSKELTGFLLSQAASADEINLAYLSCRADSLNLREALRQ